MKILCVGGGPAGLYFSICMKLKDPSHDISVIERNEESVTNGWGIVLPEKLIARMLDHDAKSATQVQQHLVVWENIVCYVKNTYVKTNIPGFSAIGRLKLLSILKERAMALGVKVSFSTEMEMADLLSHDADLIVGSDGASSKLRQEFTHDFGAEIKFGKNQYKWLGTKQPFKEGFHFIFEETEHGWVWGHCYQFDANTSTIVIECAAHTWEKLGLNSTDENYVLRTCEKIFAKHLNGNQLMGNLMGYSISPWKRFPLVHCKNWHHKNVVLIGDAAHTLHFSIGSGTRLAMEDASDLAMILSSGLSVEDALQKFQVTRELNMEHLRSCAYNSMRWFENLESHLDLTVMEFSNQLLSRAQAQHAHACIE